MSHKKKSNKDKSNYSYSSVSNSDIEYIPNTKNIDNLKDNLKKKEDDSLEIKKLSEFLESPEDTLMNSFQNIKSYDKFRLDDNIFENKINQLLMNKLNLKAFDFFPLFEVYNSKQTGKEVTSLNYFKVLIYEEGEPKKYEYNFLAKRDNICVSYNDYTILIEIKESKESKESKEISSTIFSKDFTQKIEKNFSPKDGGNIFISSFYKGEIDSKDFSFKNESNKLKYLYKELNNYIKNSNEKDFSIALAKNKTDEIDATSSSLIKIFIELEKINKELDGFYLNNKEFNIKFGDDKNIKIPVNSYLIIEIKNNNNLKNIKNNIFKKRRILNNIGVNLDNAYFLGILNSEPTNDNNISSIDEEKHIIILYPKLLEFLDEQLYLKNDSYSMIKDTHYQIPNIIKTLNELTNEFKDMKKEFINMKRDITDMKSDITNMKSDFTNMKSAFTNMKSDITNMKSDITNMKKDITDIKAELTIIQNNNQI